MVGRFVIGACMAVLCAAPVLGEEGIRGNNVILSKFVDPGQSPQSTGQSLQSTDQSQQSKQPLQIKSEMPPQVKVTENFEYYDIDGASPDELRAQMKRNGTTWNDGRVYAALTTWDIRYHYDITGTDGTYRLSSIGTDVSIIFHMPRLTPVKAGEQLSLSWNNYLEHLKTHEFGHRDIAVDTAREIYQSLAALGSFSSKTELDNEAKSLIKARFKHLKEAQIDYDAQTHHGIKQGAVLTDPMVAGSVANAI
jgi:predicted secreted Zn-dependent protease